MFEWTKQCQACFQMLKEAICTHTILQYPDPDIPYVLFTDASKYRWAGVLIQPYEEIDEVTPSNANTDATPMKSVIHQPVTYYLLSVW